ncbi:hypothetical protein MMC26_004204 [Xylographa opegraphella]|nr:hypothetical protein [Xylographa opegraphella]
MVEADGSEDVTDFLRRIRELGDKRDREDEERTRKLEEEILQGRKERQARRAERARSISPIKDTPSNSGTPTSIRSIADVQTPQRPVQGARESAPSSPSSGMDKQDESESRGAQHFDNAAFRTRDSALGNTSRSSSPLAAALPPTTATSLSRAGTLSWQQRPTSRGSTGTKSRPLSVVATENSAQGSPKGAKDFTPAEGKELSRNQIAQSLGSKDPTWFRQTADRGLGSAAFRKSQGDIKPDTASRGGGMRLPGLSRESTTEPERPSSPQTESVRSSSPSREGSLRGSSTWSQRFTDSGSILSAGTISSPLPTLRSHVLEPPTTTSSAQPVESRSPAMSPSQGRISPERMDRPSSPTKGLGGFVQSAMLKRSDSVNKRWSAQATPGLSRGNSIASNRNFLDGPNPKTSTISSSKDVKAGSIGRETSPFATSRPGSSHSNVTVKPGGLETDQLKGSEFFKPAVPEFTPAPLGGSNELKESSEESSNRGVPSSPTKSADSKRWSPTKASWLESAINRPDSPKPKPPPQQPSWMTDINKAKQSRASVDLGKSTSFKEVSTGGLLRLPPTGTSLKSPSLNDIHSIPAFTDKTVPTPSTGSGRLFKAASPQPSEPTAPQTPDNDRTPLEEGDLGITSPVPPLEKSIPSPRNKPVTKTATSTLNGKVSLSPPSTKAKPITPPKRDFRSTLKPSQVPKESGKNDEPEFKNVFGKLKRTETKNYVAPDELKSNIMRGKAGLAATSGPQKSERRDEFMESILKKKEAMKAAGPQDISRKTSGSSIAPSQGSPVPEAIAKRRELARSGSSQNSGLSAVKGEPASVASIPTEAKPTRDSKTQPPEKKTSAPARLQRSDPPSGALGERFIPALAGLLSRGPPVSGGSRVMSPTEFRDEERTGSSDQPSEGPQLTHATKSRARGPKRRLPTSLNSDAGRETSIGGMDGSLDPRTHVILASPEVKKSSVKPELSTKPNSLPLSNTSNNINKQPQPQIPFRPSTPLENATINDARELPKIPTSSTTDFWSTKPKPSPPSKPEHAGKQEPISEKPLDSPGENTATKYPTPGHVASAHSAAFVDPLVKERELEEETSVSVLGAAARWGATSEQRPQRARSPIKLPTRKDEEAAMKQAGLNEKNAQDPIGLGIHTLPDEIVSARTPSHNLPSPPLKSPKSPPLPAKKPASIASRIVSNGTVSTPPQASVTSPVPHTSEAIRLFTDFFDEAPSFKSKIDIDTQAIMASRFSPEKAGKIKTLRKQIWEVTSYGKRLPIPSQQEHILFEDSMYLCSHVFGSPSGKRTTEVYLWCGDGMSPSAIEDVQVFSRNVAKEAGGKLIVLSQGKESSNFFEALGGIVITRRGGSGLSESSSSASATYMLCGRRHMGQIAFDEVKFSRDSLCSGFPYIVSATSGRLYLWKGKGSCADELGCARLIGMDLGLTGEIEEIDEGKEPASFWDAFPGRPGKAQSPGSGGHWHLKPNCEKYAVRLFSVDLETRPKSSSSGYMNMWGRRSSTPLLEEAATTVVREVVPFAQRDLYDGGVFVLDGFFEVWIILGRHATSKLPTFRTALHFAQEYGILAASMEDRPFVPVSHVVLAGTPPGMQTAFRKWDDRRAITQDAKGVLTVPLNAALEVLGG